MRVYLAGPYSDNNVISILNNIRQGLRESVKVFLRGHSPFSPWLDFQYQLMLDEDEHLTVEDYYRYSLDWLEVADIVYVIKLRKDSKGTNAEIKRAIELGIPIIYKLDDLP